MSSQNSACIYVDNPSMFVAKKFQIFFISKKIDFTVAKGACELELTIALSTANV